MLHGDPTLCEPVCKPLLTPQHAILICAGCFAAIYIKGADEMWHLHWLLLYNVHIHVRISSCAGDKGEETYICLPNVKDNHALVSSKQLLA